MDFNLMEIICMNAYGIIYLNANELQFSLNKITDIRTVGFAACVCVFSLKHVVVVCNFESDLFYTLLKLKAANEFSFSRFLVV